MLEAEQRDLDGLLRTLSDADFDRPTPADGWDVRDSVSHLADTEEVAHDTVTDGSRTLGIEAERHREAGGLIEFGVQRGRVMTGAEVREWWSRASKHTREALASADTSRRVPWGLGMGWRAFVTARLMEHWAHGLDIRAAVGADATDTDRLQAIGWLCYSALPYAFSVAGVSPPEGHSLRVEVEGPGGEAWTYGPADATDTITGPAGIWCRRATQRIPVEDASDLVAAGPLAELAVRTARAFL